MIASAVEETPHAFLTDIVHWPADNFPPSAALICAGDLSQNSRPVDSSSTTGAGGPVAPTRVKRRELPPSGVKPVPHTMMTLLVENLVL